MMKYVSKFALDILPSVVATIIGAYIVNHYIVTKPGADAPVAASVSSADPKAEARAVPETAKSDAKVDAKAAETSADIANLPGVRAKGISEKAALERPTVEKSTEKFADRPAEAASVRRPITPREKTGAKMVAVPMQPSASAAVPVVAAPTTEAATAPEERRDANDLARAAIERLRGTSDATARAPEAARTPEGPRVVSAPVVAPPSVRPLPPPIMVSTPAFEAYDSTTGSLPMKPPYTAAARIDEPRRPTPPADIPYARPPLDLRAEAGDPPTREHTSVAEDVLSAAKSVFHAVLPK